MSSLGGYLWHGAMDPVIPPESIDPEDLEWLEDHHEELPSLDPGWNLGPLVEAFGPTHTLGGALVLEHILRHPVSCVETLTRRQRALRDLSALDVSSLLRAAAEGEAAMLSACRDRGSNVYTRGSNVYTEEIAYTPFDCLNGNSAILQAYNLGSTVLLPAVVAAVVLYLYVIRPLLEARRLDITPSLYARLALRDLLTHPERERASLVTFAIFVMASHLHCAAQCAESAFQVNEVGRHMWTRCVRISDIVVAAEKLPPVEGLGSFGFRACGAPQLPAFRGDFRGGACRLGRALVALRELDRGAARALMCRVYLTDALHAVSRLAGTCRPTYRLDRLPFVGATGLRHPCVENAAESDFSVGHELPNNAVITGPEGSGKTTFLEGVACAVLMAQTVGVATARSLEVTPFATISWDPQNRASMGAEMARHRDQLRRKGAPGLHFCAIDDMFGGTDPVEGAAAAVAFAKRLCASERTVAILSTRFAPMTQLAEDEDFENYRMPVEVTPGGVRFTHELERGASSRFVGLELLASSGHDAEIVREAVLAREKILKEVGIPGAR